MINHFFIMFKRSIMTIFDQDDSQTMSLLWMGNAPPRVYRYAATPR